MSIRPHFYEYTARELGLNGVTVTGSGQNSNWFGVDGCNQLHISGAYTRAAGTNLAFRLEYSDDGGSTVHILQTEEITGAGSGVFDTFTHNDDDGASKNFGLDYIISGPVGRNFRIGNIVCTSGSTDSLTMRVQVGFNP